MRWVRFIYLLFQIQDWDAYDALLNRSQQNISDFKDHSALQENLKIFKMFNKKSFLFIIMFKIIA